MHKMIFIVFILSLGSVLGIAFTLGKCVEIYTGSILWKEVFQTSFAFLFSLFVSHFIIDKYLKV